MSPLERKRQTRLQSLTLALTVALAVALGGIIYLSVTSLPYLAISPTTDPTFGTFNACLLEAIPERLGFAASGDGKRVAAWSSRQLVECTGTPPVPTLFARGDITLGAYDGSGTLWISSAQTDGGPASLFHLEQGQLIERGAFNASALVGTAQGVVALEPSGQLVALSASSGASATRAVPFSRNVQLKASSDGALVALFGGGRFAVVDAVTLQSTPAEAPCAVIHLWWRPSEPVVVVDCGDLSLEINALTSVSALVEPRRRVPSTLMSPLGLYIQSCDVLPCTVEAPR